MRQLNFVLIFAACLGVSLFAMQNSSTVTVNVVPGVSFEAPLVVELLLAIGLGASAAWLFSLWSRAQSVIEFRQQNEALQERDSQITELKDLVVELESTVAQLPPSKSADPSSEDASTTIEAESEEAQAETGDDRDLESANETTA